MNLYLFNDNDCASKYGIGTYLNELTQALEGSSIHIHIIHLHSVRPKFEITKTGRIEHWYIPEAANQNTFSGSACNIEKYCRNINRLLRLYVNDTHELVFHFNFNLYQLLAKEIKKNFNCKTVTTIHFMKWALEFNGNLSRFLALKNKPENQLTAYEQILYKTDKYEAYLYKEADRIIALSRYTQILLCDEYQINPNKISVIPNGLEDKNPVIETVKKDLRRKWNIPKKAILILFAGRITEVKGLISLISAFRFVSKRVPHCRMIIAGNGDFDTYMKECEDISTKITWTGFVDKNILHELYSIADIGVIPSFHEQCSYVAIEMMCHKLPIIGSTSTGLKEMIVDGETGLHIPVIELSDNTEIDSILLSEKILSLIENQAERQRMGQNSRKQYEEKYSRDMFRKNMLNFYYSLFEQ
jgi:glycosyltransferase